MELFSVGTDPEGFAVDKNGRYRSVVGLLGGTKTNPRQTKHGFVQEDNVAWEFNTHPVFSHENGEDSFLREVLGTLSDITDLLKPLDLSVDISPIALFDDEELLSDAAKQAGCSVDFNAWTIGPNRPPDLSMTNMRSAGGHLHIAWSRLQTAMDHINFTRAMDQTAGIPSIIMDSNTERRKLYGSAGCYRGKSLRNGDPFDGIEYRTLSNFWVKKDTTIRWAYQSVSQAIHRFDELVDLAESNEDRIVHIINNSDVHEARLYCEDFKIAIGE